MFTTTTASPMRWALGRLRRTLVHAQASLWKISGRSGFGAALLTIAMPLMLFTSAAPASAGGWVTIFPNYGDWNCGPKGGVVQHVKVAAFPGETQINANNQRWARINVGRSSNVRIVAQVYCVHGFFKTPGGWNTVDRTIKNPVPWRSYYF